MTTPIRPDDCPPKTEESAESYHVLGLTLYQEIATPLRGSQ